MFVNQILIVPFDKKNNQKCLIMAPLLIAGCILFLKMNLFLKNIFGLNITMIVQSIIIVVMIMFVIMFFSALFLLQSTKPAAILDKNGIWLAYFGFISWSQVDQIYPYLIMGTPMEVIAIQVKDVRLLFKQASLGGKISLFWSKIFGGPHITISNTALSSKDIFSFARNFIQQKSDEMA
jgi:hypothetical protein